MKVADKDISKAQGHWLLAKMGKRVLRPGGKELTLKLVENLKITGKDDVIEFAPGLGFTANLSLQRKPNSYTGIDADNEVIASLQDKLKGNNLQFLNNTAEDVNLKDGSATKLYGEAMLTMHADHRKLKIIKEAHRLLKTGGLYAIHEIGLTPDTISTELKSEIQKELAKSIHVNARPLTIEEWKVLLIQEGFEIVTVETNGMFLLENKRLVDDEGFFRALKIGWNIITNAAARKRILDMRSVFRKYQDYMNSIVIIAKKI